MRTKLLSYLTVTAAIIAALAALDLSGIATLIPGDHAAPVAWISGGLATALTIVRAIGDLLDDGKPNGSFKCPAWVAIGALLLACACMTSCGTPLALRVFDPEHGIGASYSSKGGIGIEYVRPIDSSK
jgi:hypothetical protein